MTSSDHVAERSVAIRETPQFQALRRSFLTFIAPLTVLFLIWYLVYVLLAGFAPGFFAIPVFGLINVGMLFGFGQFVSTFAITMIYRSWANKRYDAKAEELRDKMLHGLGDEETRA